jgi:hypothetical protein
MEQVRLQVVSLFPICVLSLDLENVSSVAFLKHRITYMLIETGSFSSSG